MWSMQQPRGIVPLSTPTERWPSTQTWPLANGMEMEPQSSISTQESMPGTQIMIISARGQVRKHCTQQSGMVYGLKHATLIHLLAMGLTLAVPSLEMVMQAPVVVLVSPKVASW